MMRYLLDTNAAISLLGRKSALLVRRILSCDRGEIGLSTIVVHELYYGAYRSQRVAENLETVRQLQREFEVLDFESGDDRVSGEIRNILAKAGTPIGPYDLLIAGQAKARGLTVVTNNIREFSRVSGLKIEDWTQATPPTGFHEDRAP